MANRIIQSPGVQISEVDLSLTAAGSPPTTVFIPGFAPKGPAGDVVSVSSLSEFEQIYGTPTNAAERYFYHSVAAVFQSNANVQVYRIPYGAGAGLGTSTNYSALVYPVVASTPYNQAYFTTNSLSALSTVSNFAYIADTSAGTSGLSSFGVTFYYPATYTATPTLSSLFNTVTTSVTALADTTVLPLLTSVSTAISNTLSSGDTYNVNRNTGTYYLGQPIHYKISENQYLAIQNGSGFTWNQVVSTFNANVANTSAAPTLDISSGTSLGNMGMIVLNKSQSSINSRFEGFYIGAIDNTNHNPATPFNDVNQVLSVNNTSTTIGFGPSADYVQIPDVRLNFALSASPTGVTGSISEVLESMSTFDISTLNYNDVISLGVFKLRQSVFSPDTIALDYVLSESYVGSLDYYRQINSTTGGRPASFFLGDIDSGSPNIQILVNPYISNQTKGTSWLNLSGVPSKSVRMLNQSKIAPRSTDTNGSYISRMGAPQPVIQTLASTLGTTNALIALGDYSNQDLTTKLIGDVPTKVNYMLQQIANDEVYPLSVVTEAGLGTVYANAQNPATSGYFDDGVYYGAVQALTAQNITQQPQVVQDYQSVAQQFVSFATNVRKDHIFIADPLTNIFITANNSKTLDNPNNTFSDDIYWPLRNQFSIINSSYVAVYGNCVRVADAGSNRQVWVPFSGFAAAAMATTDTNSYPWFAPAGFTRGIVTGVTDIGIYPNQKQRDQIYNLSINPVVYFPNEGFIIFGQRTMLKQPSAFDRINVRRLFLYLETRTKQTAQFYVFEPNSLFTRTQVKNVLTPIFELAKNTQGLYDYLIVCDERNNTPSVIDDNSLVVDIYLKPVRSAEFILVNFYATRTDANFSEIVA